MLVLKGLVGLHRTVQLQLPQHYWLGNKKPLKGFIAAAAAAAKSLQSCPTLCTGEKQLWTPGRRDCLCPVRALLTTGPSVNPVPSQTAGSKML